MCLNRIWQQSIKSNWHGDKYKQLVISVQNFTLHIEFNLHESSIIKFRTARHCTVNSVPLGIDLYYSTFVLT